MKMMVTLRPVPDVEQLVLKDQARLRIQRTERLVHQHDLGRIDQRPNDVGPLPHAAGELVRIGFFEAGEADHRDQIGGPIVTLGFAHPATCSGKETLSISVRHGIRLCCWVT